MSDNPADKFTRILINRDVFHAVFKSDFEISRSRILSRSKDDIELIDDKIFIPPMTNVIVIGKYRINVKEGSEYYIIVTHAGMSYAEDEELRVSE